MEFTGDISVTYENGVLRPDEQLNLPEGTRLRASIHGVAPDPKAAAAAMEAIRRISDSGVFRSGGRRFTRDQMHERD